MRARSRPDPRVVEAAQRRLEALVAELGGPSAVAADDRPRRGQEDEREDDEEQEEGEVAGPDHGPDDGEEDGTGTGRHARRPLPTGQRATSWAGDRLPAPLVAMRLGGRHVAVVVVLLVVGVLLAGWTYLRTTGGSVEAGEVVAPRASGGVQVEAPGVETRDPVGTAEGSSTASVGAGAAAASPSGGSGAAAGGAPEAAGAEAAEGQVVVDVEGKVRRPGIAVLPTGSRVVDALDAVGGARPGADLRTLNLARVLVDGEQLLVDVAPAHGVAAGALTGPPAAAPPTGSGPAPTAPALVNLNSADQVALETLPGVGPVTAAAILQWRTEHGAFASVDELLEVSGIGDATLAEIAPHVTL